MKRLRGQGRIWERRDSGFDQAVLATSFNGRDPGVRPKVFVEANTIEDVSAALARARDENLKVSICSGGHSWAQNHLREGGLLLSMARFNSIEVNPDARTAKVGPGCWSIDVDRALRRHGLFFPIAHVNDVAMGGFLLQGGFGWASRELGIAAQSVVGLDLMLANGDVVHASETQNSDLYWAARGSGPGFFAVVLCYHIKLYPRFKYVGFRLQVFRIEHLEEVFKWAEEIGPDVSRQVEFQMVMTPKALGIFKPGIEVVAPVLTNSKQEAKEATQFILDSPIRKKAGLTLPLLPIQTGLMSSIANFTHFPANAHWCADNMWTNSSVDELLPGLERIAKSLPPAPSHALWLNWHPPKDRPEMAFSVEAKHYLAAYGVWFNENENAQYASWAGDCMKRMEGFSEGIQLADENLGNRPARFAKDENMAKLDTLRAKFDPLGLFQPWMHVGPRMAAE